MANVDLVQEILKTICDDVYVAICEAIDNGLYQTPTIEETMEDLPSKGTWKYWKDRAPKDPDCREAGSLHYRIIPRLPPPPNEEAAQPGSGFPFVYIYQGELFTDDSIDALNEDGWVLQVHIKVDELQIKGSLPSVAVIQKALVVDNPRRQRRGENSDGKDPCRKLRDEVTINGEKKTFVVHSVRSGDFDSRDEFGLVADIGSFRLDNPDPYDEWRQRAVGSGLFDPIQSLITIQFLFVTSRIDDDAAREAGIPVGLYVPSLDD